MMLPVPHFKKITIFMMIMLFGVVWGRGALAACSSPAGSMGQVVYNADYGVLQFCNGYAWNQMGGVPCVTSGLVGQWKFDEVSGTTASDSWGGNNGTLVNTPTWGTGKVGGALTLNGTNQKVNVPTASSLDLSGSFSIGLWAKVNASAYSYFIEKAVAGTTDNYFIYYDPTLPSLRCGYKTSGGTFYEITPTWNPTLGAWYHLFCTFDNTSKNLVAYVNGSVLGSGIKSGSPGVSTGSLQFGYSPYNSGSYSAEAIDDVRIYNRALSGAEVTTIYNGGVGCQ